MKAVSTGSQIGGSLNRSQPSPRERLQLLRLAVYVAMALDLGLIALHLLLEPSLLRQPGSLVYVAEPIVGLAAYAACAWVATSTAFPERAGPQGASASTRVATLRLASLCGVFTGALWIVNHTLETFWDLSQLGVLATAPFLLGAFALWGAAALLRSWQTGALRSGLLAAVWSAMLCVLLTITCGLALLSFALPRLSALEVHDPDFVRSHWSDARDFAVANTFDAAFSHLLGALVVGLVVGTVGGSLGVLAARRCQAGCHTRGAPLC